MTQISLTQWHQRLIAHTFKTHMREILTPSDCVTILQKFVRGKGGSNVYKKEYKQIVNEIIDYWNLPLKKYILGGKKK